MKRKRADVASIRFRDPDTLRTQYTSAKGTKKLDSHCLMTHIPVDEAVFRVQQAEEKDRLVGEPRAPKRSAPLEPTAKGG